MDLIKVVDSDEHLLVSSIWAFRHNFGFSISRLVINYNSMTPDQLSNINRHISEQCLNKLREIEYVCNEDDLKLSEIFPNVESVSFSVASKIRSSIDLIKMFPKMRHLQLKLGLIADPKMIAHHFPHLESVSIHFFSFQGFTEAQIEIFLKLNPQIKSIHVSSCTPQFLETMNNTLPNLESLELRDLLFEFFDSEI